jgi:hypothetical protein
VDKNCHSVIRLQLSITFVLVLNEVALSKMVKFFIFKYFVTIFLIIFCLMFIQKLLIVAVTLIAVASCQQGGWVKGPDGYKYFTPEQRMMLPKNLRRIYLPPSNTLIEISNEPLGVRVFAPQAGSLAEVEATTFEYEYVN